MSITWHDQIIGGGRVITVYLGDIQIAGAVEHARSRLDWRRQELETFWHVTSLHAFAGAEDVANRRPLEAQDEATARDWLALLAGLTADTSVPVSTRIGENA